jgi:cysteine desulfurase
MFFKNHSIVTDMKKLIYADNAATTKLDRQAYEAMQEFLLEDFSNASQPYSFSRKAKAALKEARETIAECINAEPDEIAFTSGGSESNNWAIKSYAIDNIGSDIITSNIEHHSVLNAVAATKKFNCNPILIPADAKGIIIPDLLSKQITENTSLVSIMTANNEIGTIEPIAELCNIAHEHNTVFHTDAVQAIGHIPIDVKKMGVDLISSSAHKFNGPKGVGFLYHKKGVGISSLIDGGSQENGMRAGTENIAGVIGMAVALKNNISNLEQNKMILNNLENTFISVLKSHNIDFIRNGSTNHLPGNINISIEGADGEMLLHRLDLMGIMISTGSACDSVKSQISHVIKAIGVPSKFAKGTIRISLGKNTTENDIITIADSLAHIINAH